MAVPFSIDLRASVLNRFPDAFIRHQAKSTGADQRKRNVDLVHLCCWASGLSASAALPLCPSVTSTPVDNPLRKATFSDRLTLRRVKLLKGARCPCVGAELRRRPGMWIAAGWLQKYYSGKIMHMHDEPQNKDLRNWRILPTPVIEHFFNALGKHVIYFAGYGELGYEEEYCVRRVALKVLAEWPPSTVVVHAGTLLRCGGHNGIAEVYAVARELGIETTGIHPSVALAFAETHRVSPYCDHVFFAADSTWGGFLPGGHLLSTTLRLHLAVSHEMIAIGGGKHAADELKAFVEHGKPVRFFPAEMNHASTQLWAMRSGVKIGDTRGAAHLLWASMCENVK